MILQKIEVRFEKGEAVRFISHHDLMRAFQRAVRRAGWPVRLTEGFNPRPRIVFPAALEVGVASLDEVAEIELTQWHPLPFLQTNLMQHLPPGLVIRTLAEIPPSRKAQAPLEVRYRIHLAEAGLTLTPQELSLQLSRPALPFLRIRKTKDGKERKISLDLKPFIAAAEVDAAGDLVADIRISPQGAVRPLEMLSSLLLLDLQALKTVRVTKLRMRLKPVDPTPPQPPSPNPPPRD